MKVYVLVGEWQEPDGTTYLGDVYWKTVRKNVAVFSSLEDLKSEVAVSKALGQWVYEDYDVEEFEL